MDFSLEYIEEQEDFASDVSLKNQRCIILLMPPI